MRDYCIYCKNFANDCDRYGYDSSKPLFDWRSDSTRLYDAVRPGDWFWFFTNGTACGMPEGTAGYLVNLFAVKSKERNRGDDEPYAPPDFRSTIWAEPSQCFWVDPPLLVDAIIRPAGHAASRHIGNLLQGPRAMGEDTVSRLNRALQRERVVLYTTVAEARRAAARD
jgi:hypothetical protein